MTTDNRTNEPTDEQVEAAAVASINSHRSRAGLPTLATLDGVPNADEWRVEARAALVAAQGAAPQAGRGYIYCPEHGDLLAGNRSTRCANAPTGHEYAAPVLPSSTVDEDALAEVLCRVMDGETYEGEPCAACKQQARAVAEWLESRAVETREVD